MNKRQKKKDYDKYVWSMQYNGNTYREWRDEIKKNHYKEIMLCHVRGKAIDKMRWRTLYIVRKKLMK